MIKYSQEEVSLPLNDTPGSSADWISEGTAFASIQARRSNRHFHSSLEEKKLLVDQAKRVPANTDGIHQNYEWIRRAS
jgi:hypothetical protein